MSWINAGDGNCPETTISSAKTFTLGFTPVSGYLLVAAISGEGPTVSSVTDTVNGSWIHVCGFGGASIWSINSTSTSVPNVTINFSADCAFAWNIFEIGAAGGTPVLDTYAVTDYSTNANETLSLTIEANSTGVACATSYPSNYFDTDSGWTAWFHQTTGSSMYHHSEYRSDMGSAGTKTVWAAQGVSPNWVGLAAVAYKEPPAGGGGGSGTSWWAWKQYVNSEE